MIELEVRNARTFFSGPKKELKIIFKALRLKDKNYYWKVKFILKKRGYFGGNRKKIEKIKNEAKWLKFYNVRNKSFPTGFLLRVQRALSRREIDFQLSDKRRRGLPLKTIRHMRFNDEVDQRPEQITAVNQAIESKRGILHCATNTGKTEIAAGIIGEIDKRSDTARVLFLVHRVGLAIQTYKRFEKHLNIKVSMIGGGKREVPKHGVLVATVQTAMNLLEHKRVEMLDFLRKCDAVFIDELHVNKAGMTTKLMNHCAAPMRIGLSGTIDKKDKVKYMHYLGMCGPIIAEIRNEELVKLGRSAKPYIRFRRIHGSLVEGETYGDAYRKGIVRNRIRNRLVLSETVRYLDRDKKVVVTVARKSHGHRLLKLFQSSLDIPVEFIQGSTSLWHRDQATKRFILGKTPILIVSPIGDVGWDLPEMQAWINAAGGKGWELILQRLGRALRKKAGLNKVYITDFMDEHEPRYLLKHSRLRLKYYRNENIANIKIL